MRALISVSDKTGITEFSKTLSELGYEIISTGGTAKALTEANIPVIPIDAITNFPEMMNGRVKTLHPKIHGGLLALRDNESHMAAANEHNIEMIDLVIVNLYPFEATIAKPNIPIEEAIENIDIGGPSMIRSAAKNYRSVGVIVNPDRYTELAQELKESNGKLTNKTRSTLAVEAFSHTAYYDSLISSYLANHYQIKNQTEKAIPLKQNAKLRYGENPHQDAALYKIAGETGLADIEQLHGKELSYNNYIDLEAAWDIAKEFTNPAVAIIKHTNPCGAAIAESHLKAYKKALTADPVSAFGSIIGINGPITKDLAEEMSTLFIEAIIAPEFTPDALEILTKKPSIRLIKTKDFFQKHTQKLRHIPGAILVQDADTITTTSPPKTVTTTTPNEKENQDLKFANIICKHVKSNAIVLAKDGVTIGIGAGQMSRIKSVEIAIEQAGENAKDAVAASDAFFPFKDSVETLASAGITAIIQPGGSKRDPDSIEAANQANIAMQFTETRHFKH